MENSIKILAFLENAQLIEKKLDIIPMMYGSLGLEYITGEDLNSDDIDILIPRNFITERWLDLRNILEKSGYVMIDENEHTFEKDGVCYSYAQIEELESFAGIRLSDIETVELEGAHFKLLSLQQYLSVYSASVKDGYRVNVREKKDAEKIAFIQRYLFKNY